MTIYCIKTLVRDDRGISMTEAVIVIPFFLLVWMGFIYLHSIYEGAITAQVDAQNTALGGAAIGNCPGTPEDEGTNQDVDDALMSGDSSSNVGGTSVNTNVLIQESGGSSMFDWSHHIIGSSVEVDGIPSIFGGPTQTVKGGAKVMCNMEPRDGLGDMIYGFLQDIF